MKCTIDAFLNEHLDLNEPILFLFDNAGHIHDQGFLMGKSLSKEEWDKIIENVTPAGAYKACFIVDVPAGQRINRPSAIWENKIESIRNLKKNEP